MATSNQYACTNCFNWFRFEQLAEDSQLCMECLNNKDNCEKSVNGQIKDKKKKSASMGKMRCKFCRTEFHNENSTTKNHVCERCAKNKVDYGEPRTCSLCNLHAAFIGSKCRRCVSSVKKYGPPESCSQCKLKAAFHHPKVQDKKKLLCWLCTSTAQKAMKKVKRRASEEAITQGIKKSRMWTLSTEGESSPTEIVIEEEVIHEKDLSDQNVWDDFPPQDMDYRLPAASSTKLQPKPAIRIDSPATPPDTAVEPNRRDKGRVSSSRGDKDSRPQKHEKANSIKNDEKYSPNTKTLPADLIAKVKKNRLKFKETRRSAPADMNATTKHKHDRHLKQALNNSRNKAKVSESASHLLDAKIMHLQKKLSHKKGIGEESSPDEHQNLRKISDTLIKKENSASDKVNRSMTSLPTLKTLEGSSKLERFRATDSASSSPLPAVNDGNIVIVSQLRAEISSLKKQLGQKDKELFAKDKQMSCIKVEHLREQRDLRAKMKDLISRHSETLEQLQTKNQDLLKKVSQLSKGRA